MGDLQLSEAEAVEVLSDSWAYGCMMFPRLLGEVGSLVEEVLSDCVFRAMRVVTRRRMKPYSIYADDTDSEEDVQ